jgi:hypothetical protein
MPLRWSSESTGHLFCYTHAAPKGAEIHTQWINETKFKTTVDLIGGAFSCVAALCL